MIHLSTMDAEKSSFDREVTQEAIFKTQTQHPLSGA